MAAEKILIILSDPDLGALLEQKILPSAGYNATYVADLSVAQDLLKRADFNLVLMGEQIGDQNSMNIARNLSELLPGLPLILLSRNPSASELAFRNGFWDALVLPLDSSQVTSAVSHAIQRSTRLQEWINVEARRISRGLQRRMDSLESLQRVGRSVTSFLELDSILTTVVDAAVEMTAAEEGSLLLLDEATGELYMRAARNFQDDFVRKFRLPIRDSLPGQVMRTGKPLAINASTPQKIKTSYLVHTLIYVPLTVHNRVIGVLGVDNRQGGHPFQEEHLGLISTLADYAAVAIENSRAFSATELERKKLETVLTKIEDGVMVVDHDGRLVLVNPTICNAFGVEPVGWVGKPVADVFPNLDLLELFDENKLHPIRVEICLEDGRVFNAQLTPIPEVGSVVTMQDITHLKELDRIKSDFVDTVSHDLRTPLTAILGYVELIERSQSITEQQHEFLKRIKQSVHNITSLINDLLDLGRIETGFDSRKEIISIKVIIDYALEGVRNSVAQKELKMHVRVPERLPVILGNPVRLRQLFANLIGNAIKFTPTGGKIEVRAVSEQDQLILQVQDSGPGIPAADQPYIFNKFYRASNVSAETTGTGLGLAIVKSIVDNHKGRIWVESSLGEGTIFTVVLPVNENAL